MTDDVLVGDGAALTDEFWAAAARGALVRPVCQQCSRSFFTPRVVCPHCRSASWAYVESSGIGTVYSHTTVHRGPDATWEVPYVLGIVDVDEGWYLLTRLLVEPPDESTPGALIGARVGVRFVPGHPPDDRWLPAFELLAGGEPDPAASTTDTDQPAAAATPAAADPQESRP